MYESVIESEAIKKFKPQTVIKDKISEDKPIDPLTNE